MNQIVEFTCTITFNPCNQPNFKIYSASIDLKKYPDIKQNEKYGGITLSGNIHDLGIGIDYHVKAEEILNKQHGWQYKVLNIKRERPTDNESTRLFLSEILVPSHVSELMTHYPDIVDRVINDRLDDIDLKKLYNIGQYRFDVIKQKIIENFALAELVEAFNGLIDFQTLKKLYEKYTSTIKVKQALKEDPYKCLCGLSRISFKTADSILLELDKESKKLISEGNIPPIDFGFDLKASPQREKSAIIYLLEENEQEGNTKISVKRLKTDCEKLTPACSHHFVDIIKDDAHIYYDKETKCVSLKKTYETEVYIRDRIINGLKENNIWSYDTKKYTNAGGVNLTEQQSNALVNLCKFNISILNGFGGSGKTQSTKAIISMLKDNKKEFLLLAPTGRASKILAGYCNEPASTIHRGLGYGQGDGDSLWAYNKNNPLHVDVVIVDEFSMCDIFLTKILIEAIDFKRTKLLIVGDSAQIPSVSAGNVLHDLLNSEIIPMTTLTKIFRYGEGGLMTVATKTRNCEEFLEDSKSVQIFGTDKSYAFIPTQQTNILQNVVNMYKKLLLKYNPEDILVLSSYNKGEYGTVSINNRLQPITNENARLKKNSIQFGEITYFKDDLVIQIVNNYRALLCDKYGSYIYDFDGKPKKTFICNGEIGKIISTDNNQVIIKFDEDLIVYSRSDLSQLKLAYSISLHKSQGGQAKVIVLLTPKSHTFMLNSNLIYVGQTRAKERVYHFGEIETVNKAIKKKANFNRSTFLKDLLIKL